MIEMSEWRAGPLKLAAESRCSTSVCLAAPEKQPVKSQEPSAKGRAATPLSCLLWGFAPATNGLVVPVGKAQRTVNPSSRWFDSNPFLQFKKEKPNDSLLIQCAW